MAKVPSAEQSWNSGTLPSDQARRALGGMLPYCFPAAIPWRITPESGELIVHYTAEDAEQRQAVENNLSEALERSLIGPHDPPQTLVDRWALPVYRTNSTPADSTPVGPGLRVLGPGLSRLVRAVDRLVLDMAAELGAQEYTVPHLTSWKTVARAGYSRTFPQHLTTCAVAGPDIAALDRFAAADGPQACAEASLPAPVVVSPTVCLNLFAALADQPLNAPVIATAAQSCGRYEARDLDSPTRLWSFSMREIIYVGDAAGASRFRSEVLDRLTALLSEIALPGRIVAANDPFFTRERRDLVAYQSKLTLKHELCGRMATDSTALAVSSVNLHNQHFGRGFEIRLSNGTAASSACVGFGLERWANWLHGHLGDDPLNWPQVLRK